MSKSFVCFGDFKLDTRNLELFSAGALVRLQRLPLELLCLLVERHGETVTRDEIFRKIWGKDVFVDIEASINTAVGKLRRALGDDPQSPRFIATIPARGYRFIASVVIDPERGSADSTNSIAFQNRQLIVGRDEELKQVKAWYAQAAAGQRQVVFLSGEAGIGKSSIMQAFLDELKESSVLIARGQCIEQYGAGEPYMPVLEALTRVCQGNGGHPVLELIHEFAPAWLVQLPTLLSPADRERSQVTTGATTTQHRMLREMVQALEALSADTPLVLALEDIHWSDFSTLELISAIARRSERARLLILATYRPAEMLSSGQPLRSVRHELQLQGKCQELRLKLLSESDVLAYLNRRFTNHLKLPYHIARLVYERTDGNPLFMIELVKYLVSQPSIYTSKIEIPQSILQMIGFNLERLNIDEQQLLEAASVVGSTFSAATVAAALRLDLGSTEASCIRLARREQFISIDGFSAWPDGTASSCFRFHHELYSEVLYERIPTAQRIELHRRIAECGERAYGKRANKIVVELAHHFELANDRNKSIEYHQIAAERAVARCAMVEADYHYRAALRLVRRLPKTSVRDRTELGLLLAAGPTLMAPKGWAAPQVKTAFTRGRELSERLREDELCFFFLHGLWVNHLERLEFRSAQQTAQELLLRAESSENAALLLQAREAVGVTAHRMGRFELARECLEKALPLCSDRRMRPLGVDMEVVCRSQLAWTLALLGFPDQAIRISNESISQARALCDPFSLHFAQIFMCYVEKQRGDAFALEKIANEAISLSTEHGFAYGLAHAGVLRGVALTEQGHPEEGLHQIEEALPRIAAAGAEVNRAEFLCWLAEAHYLNGQLEAAIKTLNKARRLVEEHENRWPEVEIIRLSGEISLRRNKSSSSEVRSEFERAIDTARKQGTKTLELRVTTSLARLLATQGHLREAQDRLAEIYSWFTEGFDTADLVEAKILLHELRA